jgi:putative tricarboxylic transport membrane protein
VRTADLVTAVVLLLLGGVVLADATRLGFGWGGDGPQSGFFPFWMALIMVVCCLGVILQALRRTGGGSFVTRERLSPVLKVLWPATAMVVLTQFLGLYVASALYLGFYMRWVGGHSWRAVVVLALGVPVVTFLIFEQWFLMPLPKGPLEHWWGY